MNENLTKFIFDVAMALLFIAALSMFLAMHPGAVRTVDLLKNGINRDNEVQEVKAETGEYTVSGAEIIANIFEGPDVDIDVEDSGGNTIGYASRAEKDIGDFFTADDSDIVKTSGFNYSIINADGRYSVRNKIDENGVIEEVIYREVY